MEIDTHLKNEHKQTEKPIYKLIQEGNLKVAINKINFILKETIEYKDYFDLIFLDHMTAFNIYSKLNIGIILELPKSSNTYYSNVLNTNSEKIEIKKSTYGDYLYKEISKDGRYLDIRNVLCELNPDLIESKISSIDFLNACFGNDIGRDSELYEIYIELKSFLQSLSFGFNYRYPELSKRIMPNISEVTELVNYMLGCMTKNSKSGKIKFTTTLSQTKLISYIHDSLFGNQAINSIRNSFFLIKALEQGLYLSEGEVDSQLQRKSKFNQNGLLDKLECIALILNENSISIKNINKVTLNNLIPHWGTKTFPRTKENTKKEINYTFFENHCLTIIQENIIKKGYCTNFEVKEYVSKLTNNNFDNVIVTVRKKLITDYGLNYARASSHIREQKGWDNPELLKAPFIYYKN